jgi:hypothetical protein
MSRESKLKPGDKVIANLGPGPNGIKRRATVVKLEPPFGFRSHYEVVLANGETITMRDCDLEPVNALDRLAEEL